METGGSGFPQSPPDIMDLIAPQDNSVQENNPKSVVLEQRISSDSPMESPNQKLSPAEIQRKRINAASEYYRKLREGNSDKNLGPPPPLIPTGPSQAVLNLNCQQQTKPNIDLGAIVRSTIINGVTKTFTQHWIVVAGSIRVLLLDFDGSFTLLIPGVEPGKAFRSNQVNVEVQKKEINNGHLTFMKFVFPSPSMEISAPVLLDKQMGFQVLKQNSACVFLGRILDSIKKPPQQPSLSQLLEQQQQQEEQHQISVPSLPSGTVIVPAAVGTKVQISTAASTEQSAPIAVQIAAPQAPSTSVFQAAQPVVTQIVAPSQQVQLIPQATASPQLPLTQPPQPVKPVQPPSVVQEPVEEKVEEGPKQLLFVEDLKDQLYKALKPKELDRIIQCRYCPRQFKFLSEHLSHLKKHTQDVDSVVEMSIKIWVSDRKLKCDKCKFKTSYTLDYAKHLDTHVIKGLACSICQCEVSTPQAYGEHMEIHHPSLVFSVPETVIEPEPAEMPRQPMQPTPQVQNQQQTFVHPQQISPQTPVLQSHLETSPQQTFQPSPQQTFQPSPQILVPPSPQPTFQQSPQVPSSPQIQVPPSPQQPFQQSPQVPSSPQIQVPPSPQQAFQQSPQQAFHQSPKQPFHQSPQFQKRSPQFQQSPLVPHTPPIQQSPHISPLQQSPQMIHQSPFHHHMYSNSTPIVQSPQDGPQKVLETLLDGSPEGPEKSMPILDTRQVSIRESLDSHEDELLEDLASYSEELINKENEQIDESVVSLANDLIGKIEDQEFSDNDSDTQESKNKPENEEDLDFQLQLSDDDEELHRSIEADSIFESSSPLIEPPNASVDLSEASESDTAEEFKCEVCGTEFVTPTSLKIHRLKCVKSQKAKEQPPSSADYACEYCKDEFRSETSLKMHRLICSKKKTEVKINGNNSAEEPKNDSKDEPKPPEVSKSDEPAAKSSLFRKKDPIREFFEREERKKKQLLLQKSDVNKPEKKSDFMPASILTQHLTCAKTSKNIEKFEKNFEEAFEAIEKVEDEIVQKVEKTPLKLKISLPPPPKPILQTKQPKKGRKKKLPKINVLPPKPPILGAFFPKTNGSLNSKGQEIHNLRQGDQANDVKLKVPKLVIKTNRLSTEMDEQVKPCKVSLKNLNLDGIVPDNKISEQVPALKLSLKNAKKVKLNIKDLPSPPQVEEEVKSPIKLTIKDLPPSMESPKRLKLTIKDIPLPEPSSPPLEKTLKLNIKEPKEAPKMAPLRLNIKGPKEDPTSPKKGPFKLNIKEPSSPDEGISKMRLNIKEVTEEPTKMAPLSLNIKEPEPSKDGPKMAPLKLNIKDPKEVSSPEGTSKRAPLKLNIKKSTEAQSPADENIKKAPLRLNITKEDQNSRKASLRLPKTPLSPPPKVTPLKLNIKEPKESPEGPSNKPSLKLNIKEPKEDSILEETNKTLKLTIKEPRESPPSPKKAPMKLTIKEPSVESPLKLTFKDLPTEENLDPIKDTLEPEAIKPKLSIKVNSRPALKLSIKNMKPVPSLKIKLPPKPKTKRSLLNILSGLTRNLPEPETIFKVPQVPKIPDSIKEEPVTGDTLVDHVGLVKALDVVSKESEAQKIVPKIMEDLIKRVIVREPKILKPITLKVHNVKQAAKKAKFKIIRVSSNKKVKRSGSGLDHNDYKGKRRKKKKKLDKLIIRNISSILPPPDPTEICSSILEQTINSLPCFKPLTLKISKDKLKKYMEDPASRRELILKRQLEIDMVSDNEDIVYGRRKAKLEARKAMETPAKKKKTKEPSPEIDPVVVDSIFEQLMGDESSCSSIGDQERPPNNNLEVRVSIEKLVQEEIEKEMKGTPSKIRNPRPPIKKEMWITHPPVFAKKSCAPPPKDEEITIPLTEFQKTDSDSDSNASTPNIVKTTIKAIQLKANDEEVLESGSQDVLDMIDDLFENFFDNCKDQDDEEGLSNTQIICKSILNEVVDKVIGPKEPKTPLKRPRKEAFSRGSYVKRRRKKAPLAQYSSTDSSEVVVSNVLNEIIAKVVKNDFVEDSDSAISSDAGKTIQTKKNVEEEGLILQLDSDSSSSDEMGKGKRKRFQNVRMLPIENVVKSPRKS